MLSIEEIKTILQNTLDSARYKHTLSTAETARKLAERWGADPDRAYLAGLVHDCAKDLSGKELLQAAEERHLTIDPIDRESPHLLHCSVGAAIAKEKFGIEDEEILSAVRCHTMGKENMTLLEKVLFLADAIEPTRTYDHLDEIRALAYRDFDRALLKTYDGIISFILKKEQLLHPDTAKARNALLMELACQNQIKHKQKNNQ